MAKDILCLKLKNLRAIQEAEIKVNGITLVSGVNGCGKSTISKMLYHLIEGISNYNELVEESESIVVQKYHFLDCLSSISSLLYDISKDKVIPVWPSKVSMTNLKQIFSGVFLRYQKIVDKMTEQQYERIISILLLYLDRLDLNEGIPTPDTLMLILENRLEQMQLQVEALQKQRPNGTILNFINNIFNYPIFSTIDLYEDNSKVLTQEEDSRVNSLLNVKRAMYIDSPFTLNNSQTIQAAILGLQGIYWDNLNKLLKNKNPLDYTLTSDSEKLRQLIEQEVLHGESIWDESTSEYLFTREDGKKFNLLDCATGEKSLSILQMLLNNGWLNKSTLLIIDEPEVHLHPQWVVEYARLIVLLNKHIGVKFFLASHNPDLVSAIKYISEKEGLGNALNFYLAEKSEDNNYQFVYRELGQDIEPIFQSFNIALDRIDAYGRMQDDD